MQRKDEILAKKAKLAELRRQREEREQRQKEHGRRESVLGGDESSDLKVPTPRRSTDRKELDSLIETLVGDRPGSRGPGTASPAARKSRPSSTLSSVQVGSETYEQNKSSTSTATLTTSVATQTNATDLSEKSNERIPFPKVEVPKASNYDKFTQTSEEWPSTRDGSDSDSSDSAIKLRSPQSSRRQSRRQRNREEEVRENIKKEIEEELKAAKESTLNGGVTFTKSKFPARELTSEELNAVTSSEEFLDFVDRSSKVIEKALDQDFDVLADYTLDGVHVDEDEDEGYSSGRGRKSRRVRQVAQFNDEKCCGKRMISDIDFSPKVQLTHACGRKWLTYKVSRIITRILHQKPLCSP